MNRDEQLSILERAAKWSQKHHAAPEFTSSEDPLRMVAERVASGALDLWDMPDDASAPWSSVVIYLEKRGIDIVAEAHADAGAEPMFIIGR